MKVPSYPSRLAAEAVGTFLFFFIGFTAVAVATELGPDAIPGTAIAAAFGIGLALAIFAFGHISGGHYNPAVTLGLAVGRQFPWKEIPGYWLAQFIGGALAAGIVAAIHGTDTGDALPSAVSEGISDGRAFMLELIATMLFVIVICGVATDKRAPWNGLNAPIAIGAFIFIAAVTVGPFTSGSFNPARSLSPAAISGTDTDLWLFILAPLVGGALGGLIFWFIRRFSGDDAK